MNLGHCVSIKLYVWLLKCKFHKIFMHQEMFTFLLFCFFFFKGNLKILKPFFSLSFF